MNNLPLERFVILYTPWLLSLLFKSDPIASYLIAWVGFFLILYFGITGKLKPLPNDRPIAEQLMRPVFIVQIIFTSYMSFSSIFYFMNLLGYEDFHKANNLYFIIDQQKLELTAQCQRYYSLGQAAFVTGMMTTMKYPIEKKYTFDNQKLANILLVIAVISFPVSILLYNVPGLTQFYYQLTSLSFISGTLALAFAIPLKKVWNTIFCVFLYISNFYQALISGFKEPIIISVLVLGIFLYPSYKKVVIVVFIPALLLLFMFLPTYNQVFRDNNWSEDVNADAAYKIALDATLKSQQSGQSSNWMFLVNRLSEIDMFTDFAKSTPDYVPFYGLQLLKQSAIAVIPRALWPTKPITEDLVMERVYNAGVIRRGSIVSAKPAFIVDAYLSGGALGVFIGLFAYGAIMQLISQKAEKLFGGYMLGTALIFSGLFQLFWRGLSFEFLVNSVFWSYITMLIIFRILKQMRLLKEI
ncbi:MAG: exosortase Y-associated Wzy-like protein [Sphingobacteriales bacterium]